MNTVTLRQQASKLVLAIALATGTAMIAGHIVPEAAHAQRKKKKDKEDEAPKAEYSKEWREAFIPVSEQLEAGEVDPAALRTQIEQIVAVTSSPDEKLQTGQLIYNAGVKLGQNATDDATKNQALVDRLRGMEMMIESGRVPAEAEGSYNFTSFQLAEVLKQYGKSRGYLQKAIDLNYSSAQTTSADLLVAMAQNHFNTDEHARGLQYLEQAIAAKSAAGEPVEERLYQIGFSVAFRNDLLPQVYDWANERAQRFPSSENWMNAINVVRRLNDYGPQPTLDLLRLSRQAGVLNEKQDYLIYVETADARRLPKEVKEVIEQGYASGAVDRDDTYLAEQLRIATSRIATDQAELPMLEKDAMAPDAGLRTVVAAGSAFLNYGDYAKAAQFYEKALGMPGVDSDEALTRLGIAQVGMEDYAGAKATFARITGPRAPIGRVWSGYAEYQAAAAGA